MTQFPVKIYHNPKCGTSRNVVAMVEQAGLTPEIVDYMTVGWTREVLLSLCAAMSCHPKAILREKGTPASELGLLAPDTSEAVLINAMIQHPVLVNRPIVVTPLGVVLARPSEKVAEVLDRPVGQFTKEDGEIVLL